MQEKYKSSDFALLFLGFILVSISGIMQINHLNSSLLASDSFVYLANAATISGYDWSDLLSQSQYYGYGYSILLVPLFALFKHTSYLYNSVVVLNTILLVGIYLCGYQFSRKILFDNKTSVLLAITSALYCGNISSVKFALADILVIFLFWLMVLLIQNIMVKVSYLKCVLLAFLSVYIYATHQRALGVMIASIFLVFILLAIKKMKISHGIAFISVFVFLFILHVVAKKYFQSFRLGNNLGTDWNDYSGLINNVKEILSSVNSFGRFLIAAVGQLYYLLMSSFLLVGWGIVSAIITIKKGFKKRNTTIANEKRALFSTGIVSIFLCLSFVFTLGISSIKAYIPTRADHLIFGRYIEFLSGPLIILAFYLFKNHSKIISSKKNIIKLFGALVGAVFIFSFIIEYQINDLKLVEFEKLSAIGVSLFYHNKVGWLFATFIVIVLSIVVIPLTESQSTFFKRLFTISLLLCTIWFSQVYLIVNEQVGNIAFKENTIKEMAVYIKENNYKSVKYLRPIGQHSGRSLELEAMQIFSPTIAYNYVTIYDFLEKRVEADSETVVLLCTEDKEKIKSSFFDNIVILKEYPQYIVCVFI